MRRVMPLLSLEQQRHVRVAGAHEVYECANLWRRQAPRGVQDPQGGFGAGYCAPLNQFAAGERFPRNGLWHEGRAATGDGRVANHQE